MSYFSFHYTSFSMDYTNDDGSSQDKEPIISLSDPFSLRGAPMLWGNFHCQSHHKLL